MATQKFGVENLKTVLGWSLDFAKELAGALKDKKFKLFEALGFVDNLVAVTELVAAVPQIKNELSELSAEEMKELEDWVADNYEFNGKVQDIIEAAVDSLNGTMSLVAAFKK